MYVWLAERAYGGPADTLGVFSSPERAQKVCQDIANEYFGERNTPPLNWIGDDIHRSAPYQHPCSGSHMFSVTRYLVDEES